MAARRWSARRLCPRGSHEERPPAESARRPRRPLQSAWLVVVSQKIWAYATIARIPALVDKAEALSTMIWAALQGVLMQMKITHSEEPLEEARRVLVPMIASYVAALASGDVPE